MRNVQGISFVRSGHHLLITCLFKYFAGDPSYRDPFFWQTGSYEQWARRDKSDFEQEQQRRHPRPRRAGDFQYCEFYSHCRTTPCSSPATTFQKNHDFDLSLAVEPHRFYLVQFRNPVMSLVSNFCAMHGKHIENLSQADWEQQAVEGIVSWRQWIDKWVLSPMPSRQRLLIAYEDLLAAPLVHLGRAVSFVTGQEESMVDHRLLAAIVAQENISPRNSLQRFRFYDPVFLGNLQQMVRKEISGAGLPVVVID